MANHPHRGAVAVDLTADWTLYTDAIPRGSIALGTVTQGPEKGALVYLEDTQTYLIIATHLMRELNTRKVRAAIHQAQTTPAEPES
ncbi:MAG: hypothetical protein QG599_739 [Pseudomonadota bacterium]|nr:hypothetical protein [Pseudomonadota bacterium]